MKFIRSVSIIELSEPLLKSKVNVFLGNITVTAQIDRPSMKDPWENQSLVAVHNSHNFILTLNPCGRRSM